MSRPRRDWTLRGAELYASKYPTARFALDIYRKHRLRDSAETLPKTVCIVPMSDGRYEVRVHYADGRKRTFWVSACHASQAVARCTP